MADDTRNSNPSSASSQPSTPPPAGIIPAELPAWVGRIPTGIPIVLGAIAVLTFGFTLANSHWEPRAHAQETTAQGRVELAAVKADIDRRLAEDTRRTRDDIAQINTTLARLDERSTQQAAAFQSIAAAVASIATKLGVQPPVTTPLPLPPAAPPILPAIAPAATVSPATVPP